MRAILSQILINSDSQNILLLRCIALVLGLAISTELGHDGKS
jgi:hypothetical protein